MTWWTLDAERAVHSCESPGDHYRWRRGPLGGTLVAASRVEVDGTSLWLRTAFFGWTPDDEDPPLPFESAVFEDTDDCVPAVHERYATWADALDGHRALAHFLES